MLKKKNLLVAILSIIFCFSMFAGNAAMKNQGVCQNQAYGVSGMPTLGGDEEGEIDGDWYYNGDGKLTLNGVDWTSPLRISPYLDLTIELKGDNSIVLIDEEDYSAITMGEGSSVEFVGSGSLRIYSSNTTLFSSNSFTLAENLKIKDADENEVSLGDVGSKQEIIIYSTHTCLYNSYSVSENSTLVAACSCGEKITTTLSVNDLVFGETIVKNFSLTDFNEKTGLSLSENSFTYQYFKVDSADDVSSEENLVNNPSYTAGYYYLKATAKQGFGIDGLILKASFEVSKKTSVITGEDKTITYDTRPFALASMFVFDRDYGTASFEIVEEGSTGAGVINGDQLTITKCGVIKIKAMTTGSGNMSPAELVKNLTVQRLNLSVGYEYGETCIFISDGFDEDGIEISGSGWHELDSEHAIPEVRNNHGGGAVTITYWLDEECLVPTTSEHGATETNGMPANFGKYYIKAEIAESNFYNAITIKRDLKIKKTIIANADNSKINITYKNLVDGKFDVTSLIVIDDDCLDSVDKIVSFYVDSNSKLNEIKDGMFKIDSIVDAENGDTYRVRLYLETKDDGLYTGKTFEINFNINKTDIDEEKITIQDKNYDANPIEVNIQENPFNGAVSIEYFIDESIPTKYPNFEGVPVDAGAYYAVIKIAETEFTKEITLVRYFKINAIEIEIVWPEDNFYYNGQVQTIGAYFVNPKGENIPLNVKTLVEFKNVQYRGSDYTYTATAKLESSELRNYRLPDDVTREYHIKPLIIEAEILDRFVYYGRSEYTLGVNVTSEHKIVPGDTLYTLTVSEPITSTTPVGVYEITGEVIENPNYRMTITKNGLFYVKNVIFGNFQGTKNMIQGWVWNEQDNEPSATAAAGEVVYSYYKGEQLLAEKPVDVPGEYIVIARVENEQSINWAEYSETFIIEKATVNIPEEDPTVYIYDGVPKSYRVIDPDVDNATLYSIGEHSFRVAGTHKVRLTINDFDYYKWPNNQRYYDLDFVIHKKVIEKPVADNRNFKYNGNPLTYSISPNSDYIVSSSATQTEVGNYKVTVMLADTNNTMWNDGTTDNIVFDFVINQSKIEKPIVVDSEGNVLNINEALIIDVSGSAGLSPETILKVEVLKSDDKDDIGKVKTQLESVLAKYDKIFKVTNVSLIRGDDEIQPNSRITLKLLVPKEIIGSNFRLYHIHVDENGNEIISKVDHSKVDASGYIVLQTDKLSSFAFVLEQDSLMIPIVTFSILSGLMFVLLVLQLVLFIRMKKKSKVLAAAAPVFYVGSEVASSIALGCVFGILLVSNVVLLVFNILAYKSKKCKKKISKKENDLGDKVPEQNESEKETKTETSKAEVKKQTTKKTTTKKTATKKTIEKKKA